MVSNPEVLMEDLRVYTFSPAWGLPTTGPFALKLLAWLNHAGIAHRQIIENRSNKGPQGKSPWITQGALILGDSDAIIRHLAKQRGMDDPTAIRSAFEARNDAMKLAYEERFHQILEWEMFLHPQGFAGMERFVGAIAPPLIGGLILRHMRRHFRRQLHARGIGRRTPTDIEALGRQQLDALALCLEESDGWLGGDSPALADFACWGQVAPMLAWPMETPVAGHAKSLPVLRKWHRRIMAGCFAGAAVAATQAPGAALVPG